MKKRPPEKGDKFDFSPVCSTTECTGLITVPPVDEEELDLQAKLFYQCEVFFFFFLCEVVPVVEHLISLANLGSFFNGEALCDVLFDGVNGVLN